MPIVGAILPFFEAGETEETNCPRLLQAAASAVSDAAEPKTAE
jgi:hypothetical protein